MSRKPISVLLLVCGAATACSLLADFQDKQVAPGSLVPEAAATTDGSIVVESGVFADGGGASDTSVVDRDTGSQPPDTGPTPFTCVGRPDGTAVPGSSRRCCGEAPTDVASNAHCGACNVDCNVGKGHSCVLRNGRAYCVGCNSDAGGGSGQCWTGCCVAPAFSPDGVCAPELPCGLFVPICNDNACATKSVGTSCHTSTLYGTYCSY